jgi:putative ABC transport system substrate-binding protein
MMRREFVALLAGMAVAPWLPARAQLSAAPMPIVTVINGRRVDAGAAFAVEFRKGLSQTGFVEGKNVIVEYHWLDGH